MLLNGDSNLLTPLEEGEYESKKTSAGRAEDRGARSPYCFDPQGA